MNTTKQSENFNELLKLMRENPTLRVVPMVSYEVVGDDSYNWWIGEFANCDIDECFDAGERIYFKSWDEEELIDNEFESLVEDEKYSDFTNEELEKIAVEKVNKLKWEKVIVIRIDTP